MRILAMAFVALASVPLVAAHVEHFPPGMHLPSPRRDASAVWTGSSAFVYGGWDGISLDEIVAFDVDHGGSMVPGLLPTPRYFSAAVWTGDAVLVIGGVHGPSGQRLAEVVKHSPGSRTVEVIGNVTEPRSSLAAGWDGRDVHALGGFDGERRLDTILRFNPATGASEAQPFRLPKPLTQAATASDGRFVYLVGGYAGNEGFERSDAIVRYDMTTGNVTLMRARLPTPMCCAAGAWDGASVIVLGGNLSSGPTSQILIYDPVQDAVRVAASTLPSSRPGASAVWTGTEVLLLGGGAPRPTHEVVAYRPNDDAVRVLTTYEPEPDETPVGGGSPSAGTAVSLLVLAVAAAWSRWKGPCR